MRWQRTPRTGNLRTSLFSPTSCTSKSGFLAYHARLVAAPGVQRKITDHIIELAFLAYHARHEDRINGARGKAGGPPTLAFACAIRNAFAHGGALHFRPGTGTVSWRGLSLSARENCEPVLGKHLLAGDVVLLMLDMAAEI